MTADPPRIPRESPADPPDRMCFFERRCRQSYMFEGPSLDHRMHFFQLLTRQRMYTKYKHNVRTYIRLLVYLSIWLPECVCVCVRVCCSINMEPWGSRSYFQIYAFHISLQTVSMTCRTLSCQDVFSFRLISRIVNSLDFLLFYQ